LTRSGLDRRIRIGRFNWGATQGECFAQLIEHIQKVQETAATLGHLRMPNDDRLTGQGFIAVSEMFKKIAIEVTNLARRGSERVNDFETAHCRI
jgi:hypothetical protein